MDLTNGEKIGLLGAVLLFVGSFLPWATWGPISVSGVRGGDGVITLLIGLGTGALIFFRSWDMKNSLLIMGAGLAGLLISAFDVADVESIAEEPLGASVEVGTGLYLTLAAGLVLISAGFFDLFFKESEGGD